MRPIVPVVFLLPLVVATGCVKTTAPLQDPVPTPTIEPAPAPTVELPESLQGRVQVLDPTDPDAADANLSVAVLDPGDGGLAQGWAVRTTQDMVVYRMWNGPDVLDDAGRTNRLGGWWSADAPAGPVDAYQVDYAICDSWNDLTWVASCTLRAGSVVAVGPGQSVSLDTCSDGTAPFQEGSELAFPTSPEHWQVYIDQPWNRTDELDCTDTSGDYRADPQDLTQPLTE